MSRCLCSTNTIALDTRRYITGTRTAHKAVGIHQTLSKLADELFSVSSALVLLFSKKLTPAFSQALTYGLSHSHAQLSDADRHTLLRSRPGRGNAVGMPWRKSWEFSEMPWLYTFRKPAFLKKLPIHTKKASLTFIAVPIGFHWVSAEMPWRLA